LPNREKFFFSDQQNAVDVYQTFWFGAEVCANRIWRETSQKPSIRIAGTVARWPNFRTNKEAEEMLTLFVYGTTTGFS
jgi:hypothetical protein